MALQHFRVAKLHSKCFIRPSSLFNPAFLHSEFPDSAHHYPQSLSHVPTIPHTMTPSAPSPSHRLIHTNLLITQKLFNNITSCAPDTLFHSEYRKRLFMGERDGIGKGVRVSKQLVLFQEEERVSEAMTQRQRNIVATLAPEEANASSATLAAAPTAPASETRTISLIASSKLKRKRMQPQWHAPWKLMRVITGCQGWVRALDVDITNEWFVSGGADRMLKIWDLASGKLKLSLTGHIATIRGVKISERHPYLFSVGEDKTVRCWDLNQNKNIKKYHGHRAAVTCVALHPSLDLIVTGGGDKMVRVWDMRTQAEVFCLEGHKEQIASVACQGGEPQIISGSQDSTVRLWDLRTGQTRSILTHHKKGVRSICLHPTEYTFATAASDSMKKWQCPEGRYMQDFLWSSAKYHTENQIINTTCVNHDGVYVSGSNDGYLHFWDWKTGNCFQSVRSTPQSGSLDCEAAVFATTFDRSGARLITGEGDKTIKVWKEDESATEESYPVQYDPDREDMLA